MEETRSWFVSVSSSLLQPLSIVSTENSSQPLSKDDKPAVPTNNNGQSSVDGNSNHSKSIETSKSIERQVSQTASSSSNYTASNTHDEVRLKSRDLLAAAFSISELPEGSADPVELAARVEDGKCRRLISSKVKSLSLSSSNIQRNQRFRCQISQSHSESYLEPKRSEKSRTAY